MDSSLYRIYDWQNRASAAGYKVSALAKACGVCRRQLQRFTYETMGQSPSAWLVGLRLTQAAELLSSALNVNEVAAQLGYKQTSHFSREFKKYFGASPLQFQRACRRMSQLDKTKSHLDKLAGFPFAQWEGVMPVVHSEVNPNRKAARRLCLRLSHNLENQF